VASNWLKLNGIDTSAIAAMGQEPSGARRNIGDEGEATDGSWRVTRQTRKRDLSFQTVALSKSDAFIWESFISGEGHVWNFEALNEYSSKGLAPTTFTDCVISSNHKFGSHSLNVELGSGVVTWPALINSFGATASAWTVMFWWRDDGGDSTFHHFVVRSDGAKWHDGVRNDATVTTFFSVSGGNITFTGSGGDETFLDDLIAYPFSVPDTWPAIVAARTTAFQGTPYLEATGDLVPEASTRVMRGDATEVVMKSADSSARRRLQVDLKAK
jgi:hypothetical protein